MASAWRMKHRNRGGGGGQGNGKNDISHLFIPVPVKVKNKHELHILCKSFVGGSQVEGVGMRDASVGDKTGIFCRLKDKKDLKSGDFEYLCR